MSTTGGVGVGVAPRLQALARSVAHRILRELPCQASPVATAVPIEQMVKGLGVILRSGQREVPSHLRDLHVLGLEGLARKTSEGPAHVGDADRLHSDYEIQILSQGFRSRFTAAHELAHVVLANEYKTADAILTAAERERLCDMAAAEILTPQESLLGFFGAHSDVELNLEVLEKLSGRMRVSLSLVVNRLRQLSDRGRIGFANFCLLVKLDRSRKRHENLAPRIASVCGPKRWFLPLNSRLASVGLSGLQDAFYSVPAYVVVERKDALLVWDSSLRRRTALPCALRFKCYQWHSSGSSRSDEQNRLMAATAEIQGPDV